jgi:protein TonB
MKIFIAAFIIFYSVAALSQVSADTVYLDKDKKITTLPDYVFYRVTTPQGNKFSAAVHFRNGAIAILGTFSALEPKLIKDGHFTYFSENNIKVRDCYYEANLLEGEYLGYDTPGALVLKAHYKQGHLDGHRISYYPSGTVRRDEVYQDNVLLSGHCYDEQGKEVEFFPREVMPEYPGSDEALMDFIRDHLHYPEADKQENVQGRVIISFVIDTAGDIKDIAIKEGVSAAINNEAIRIIHLLSKFKPGMREGKPVSVEYAIPIKFALSSR